MTVSLRELNGSSDNFGNFRFLGIMVTPLNVVHFYFKYTPFLVGTWGSVVGIETGYRLDYRAVGVRVPVESRTFPSPRRPDQIWGPASLLSNA
jgi:hypothetical protein